MILINYIILQTFSDTASSNNGVLHRTSETPVTCQDDSNCHKFKFNLAVCEVQDIKDKCCQSCPKCQDELICESYPMIKTQCQFSNETRHKCPRSCGRCKDRTGKKLSTHIYIYIYIYKLTHLRT